MSSRSGRICIRWYNLYGGGSRAAARKLFFSLLVRKENAEGEQLDALQRGAGANQDAVFESNGAGTARCIQD